MAWMEKFLLGHSSADDRARLAQALDELQTVFNQIPTYVSMKRSNSASQLLKNRPVQEDLYDYSKIHRSRNPTSEHFEISVLMSTMPKAPEEEEAPPAAEEGVRRDQRSSIYFPGGKCYFVSSYKEQFS